MNNGRDSVTITDVEFVNPVDLELIDVVLLPMGKVGGTLVGSNKNWPPDGTGTRERPRGWDERVSAIGAVIEPGEDWNFLMGFEALGEASRADGAKIEYRNAAGRRFSADHLTDITVLASCEDY